MTEATRPLLTLPYCLTFRGSHSLSNDLLLALQLSPLLNRSHFPLVAYVS